MKRALKKTVCVILLLSLVLGYIPATAISIPVRQEKSIQLQTETIVIPGAMDPDQRIRTVKTTTQQVDYAPLAEVEYLTDYAEAGAIMRKAMKNREATVSIPIEINFDESLEDAVEAILSHAVAHTGDPTEGDYLDKQRGQISAEATYYPDSDEFQFVINFTLTYYTTAQQEAQVDAAVADLLESLHLDGKTDYEKVSAVYDWMCANITYDYEHLNDPSYTLMYTAYAALIDHTSVCQGYATLLYRMMLELGIDCRVITGIANGGGHAWNIVEVGGLYYNADATWDASWYQAGAGYNFFLRADDTFEDHTRDVNFDNVWFREEYPMTRTDFNINAACVHNYISVVLDPSCTEQGYTTRTCEYCGDSYTEYYKDAYGHAFWDWITAVEPTETTYGRQYRKCWHCGLIEEKEFLLVPELVNTMIFSTDGVAYLYGEYGQLMNTYTGWMTEVYEVEDDYAINAGGYMTTAPWFFDTFWVERVVIEDGVSPVSTDHWFDYFSELTSVTFPASITNVGYYIFHACDNLREIWFKGDAPTFSEWAFDYSYETITAYYPAGNATWTEVITRDFAYDVIWVPYEPEDHVVDSGVCGDNLTWELSDDGVLTISGTGDMYNYTDDASVPWTDYVWEIKELVIGDSVTSIGDNAFNDCFRLTSVTIPGNVRAIGNYAFYRCSGLGSVTIEDGVTSIGQSAFYGCYSMTGITIPESVTMIGISAFEECAGLTELYIPGTVNSIEARAFANCSGLTSVTIGDGVVSIGESAFYYCNDLTEIMIPDSVTSLGAGAFQSCFDLTTVSLGNGITDIPEYAFASCDQLTNITFGNITQIGDGAFLFCNGLTSMNIPDGVTRIGYEAFRSCSNLRCVTIPASVTTIDNSAFYWCLDLWHILYKGTEEQWNNITICDGNEFLLMATRHNNCNGTEVTNVKNKVCEICACQHIWDEGVITVAPGCETAGERRYTCTACGNSYVEAIPAVGHSYGEWYVVTEPTEYADGEERRDCSVCGCFETRPISTIEHVHSYEGVVTAPTCTESGYTTYVCSCGESYISDSVDPLGHAFGEWEVVKAPTCTEHGEEKRSCTRCDFYETQTVLMVDHDYTPVVTAPTCTLSGYTTYVCVCGESYISDTVDPLGHAFGEWEVVKAPTCTEHGEEKRSCTRCDFYETQVVQMVGHEYTPVVIAPTCTEIGYTTYVCSCGESYIGDVSPALGHAFGEWEVVKAPTCTEQGQEKRTCTRCDYSETQTMQTAEHEYTAVVTDPTCLTKGYTTYTCHCGASYISDVVPWLGHNFSEWEVVQEPTQSGAGMEIRTCLRCGTTETHSIPALGTGKYAEGTLAFCADGIAYLYGADGVIKETFTGWMTDTYEMASTPSGEMIITTPWYAYRFEITYVNIESGVSPASTNRWFFGFTNLISAVIGDGVTSIGDDAFFGCEKLPQIIIPSNVTSIGSFAFSRAASLTEIIFEGDAPEIGEYAFHEVAATAKYPAWNTTWTGAVKQSYMGNLTWYGYWVDSMGDLAPKCVNGHLCLEMVTEPTCSNSGYTTYICPDCGDSYVSNYVDAQGHTLGEWTMIKGPTCAQEGEEVATCIWCGHQESRVVEKLEHSYYIVVTQPTCTEGGYTSHICGHCGASYTTDHVEPAGHAWDDGVVTKEPTTEAEGEKTYTCTVCGETRVETIAKKADVVYDVPEDNSVTIPENDCFEAGTIVTVDVIEDGERFELVTQIMETVTNQYVAFEFSASRDDVPVQPNGKLTVTIHIPKGFSNNVCVYYMDENGQLTTLETVVDEQNRTVTVDIPHFSTYILADQGAAPDGLLGDVNGDGKINSRDARALLRYIAGLVGEGEIDTTVADYNGDGKINSRDARALLRSIAGLD